MKIYLVGGAVRDQLLGLPVKEKDWVVVGATVDDMLKKGFRQVGKDFPVFLHPDTKEEYALARTERKTGRGYTEFAFNASSHVTLEEDLKRRDLTINAIAQTSEGVLIDPYHGQDDLANKILRHVSPAFIEDPVRILRVARFAARFQFHVAPETMALMHAMVVSGEVHALVAERVWKELERALREPHPNCFFETLADCRALPVLFPEIQLDHPGMAALIRAVQISSDAAVRFAALLYCVSVTDIKLLCDRYRIPNDYRELAILVSSYFPQYEKIDKLNPEELVDLLYSLDAFRREVRFEKFLQASKACAPQGVSTQLLECYRVAKAVDIKSAVAGLQGKEIAEKIYQLRKEAIQTIK